MKEVAKEVSAKSNGRIDIKIFPANQLGDYTLVYEELIRGTIDMALISVLFVIISVVGSLISTEKVARVDPMITIGGNEG